MSGSFAKKRHSSRAEESEMASSEFFGSADLTSEDSEEEDQVMSSVRLPVTQLSVSSATSTEASGAAAAASTSRPPPQQQQQHTLRTQQQQQHQPQQQQQQPRARKALKQKRLSSTTSTTLDSFDEFAAERQQYAHRKQHQLHLHYHNIHPQRHNRHLHGHRPQVIRGAFTEVSNDADDERDEDESEDSVFAHVIIGSGSISSSGDSSCYSSSLGLHNTSQPPPRPRSGQGFYGNSSNSASRQSNSFELAVSPQQRQRQLRFLRSVHSAQARLTQEAAVEKRQYLGVDVTSHEDHEDDNDDDEPDENSVGGLGKQIRKLSSRTIEFCDSIDELQASRASSSSAAFSIDKEHSSSSSHSSELRKQQQQHQAQPQIQVLKSPSSRPDTPLSPLQETDQSLPEVDEEDEEEAGSEDKVFVDIPAPKLRRNFSGQLQRYPNPPEINVGPEPAQVVTNTIIDMKIPQFSLSVESDTSHRSHDSASTVVTNTTITHNSSSPSSERRSSGNEKSLPNTQDHRDEEREPQVRQKPQVEKPHKVNESTSRKPAKSSASSSMSATSSIAGTITNWASSLLAKGRQKASSVSESKVNRSSSRGSSQERPLKINQPATGMTEKATRSQQVSMGTRPTRNVFRRQDTPHYANEMMEPPTMSPMPTPPAPQMHSKRRGALHARLTSRLAGCGNVGSDGSSSSQSQSFGSLDYMTPPSIVCTEHDEDRSFDTNSSNATPIGSDRPDCDTPIMDEFAQFVNASIHPPNELSVPRCYPTDPHGQPPASPTLLHPMSMPASRRSSATRSTALGCASYRNARSLSLGYQQQQQYFKSSSPRQGSVSPGPIRASSKSVSRSSTLYPSSAVSPSGGTSPSGLASPGGTRPVLRRESAQDFGDGVEVDNPRMRLNLPKQPPDLKIELLSEPSSATSPSSASPYYGTSSCRSPFTLSPGGPGSGLDPSGSMASPQRRLSNCGRTPPIARNKSAPATPLSRSISSMNQHRHFTSSPSRDGYLAVPERLRGSSLPEGREKKPEGDLYRLRQFTVSNKRIVQRSDSLQPRRSVGSVHSSASSSLSHSHSGRSSLRSSTEDDDPYSSRNSSLAIPRYTVLMLGAAEVGKTSLTNQFMSASDVGAYSSLTEEEYDEKSVSVLLDGEEAELVFIDHPSSEISVENAMATYIPDAMVIVFSVVSADSLAESDEILQYLWRTKSMVNKAVILVGNKTDLVRSRSVNIADAKAVATSYDCKYTETSAALNHNVDELLVGILTQIRLKLNRYEKGRLLGRKGGLRPPGASSLSTGGASGSSSTGHVSRRKSAGVKVRGLLERVLGGDSKSKSCDDLLVL